MTLVVDAAFVVAAPVDAVAEVLEAPVATPRAALRVPYATG